MHWKLGGTRVNRLSDELMWLPELIAWHFDQRRLARKHELVPAKITYFGRRRGR